MSLLAGKRQVRYRLRPPPRSLSNLQVFPETAEEPAIGGLLRLRFGLRGDRFWPEGDFGRFVSGPRNPVSPMQIDVVATTREDQASGCDAPVADVTRVLRTCVPLHPARARLMAAAVALWRKSRCKIASASVSPGVELAVLHAFLDREEQQKRSAHMLLAALMA